MDTSAYLDRIGLSSAANDLDSLRKLHEHHLYAVAFENLDIHRGVPIVLEVPALLDKIVRRRRGGFCYELNGAFAWLLENLGFEVTLLSAEVSRPDGSFGIPFDHMTLRVEADGSSWLADVGFGESFLLPLPLESGGGRDYYLLRRGDQWTLMQNDAAKYRFTLTPRTLADFETGCRYHQSSEESMFTQKLVTTRATPGGGRLTLTPERLLRTRPGSRTEKKIHGLAPWRDALREHFGIELETDPCAELF